jgi:hypothetical protein
MRILCLIAAFTLPVLGACSQEPETSPDVATDPGVAAPMAADTSAQDAGPAPEFYSYDGWIGRWIGVEGMYLNIQPTGDGTYQLEMQAGTDADSRGTYVGTPVAAGIRFEREGERFTLNASDGAATGLKWLDGKQDCLTVRQGEGYCRD